MLMQYIFFQNGMTYNFISWFKVIGQIHILLYCTIARAPLETILLPSHLEYTHNRNTHTTRLPPPPPPPPHPTHTHNMHTLHIQHVTTSLFVLLEGQTNEQLVHLTNYWFSPLVYADFNQ